MKEAATRLRARFSEIERKHRGEQGRARELAVAVELLRRFLPKKLAVASGEVIATDGSTSAQHDVLIYDALETPVFDEANGSVVVPIEGVYAAVEVSSTLDSTKLREDAEKLSRLKRMPKASDAGYFRRDFPIVHGFDLYGEEHRDFPILGFCFGYTGATLDILNRTLEALDADTPLLPRRIDMICSLDRGCIANGVHTTTETFTSVQWQGTPSPGTQRTPIPIDPNAEPGVALLLFFLLAFSPVVQAHTHPLQLTPYMDAR